MLAFRPPTTTGTEIDWSNTIFKYFTVPDGLDKNRAISYIRKRCYSFELNFPNFDVMQDAVKVLCDIYGEKWDYFLKTATAEYDPLIDFTETWNENKNVKDEYTRTRSSTTSRENSSTGTNTKSGTKANTATNTQTLSNTAYNSGTLQTANRTESSGNDSETTSENDSETTSENDSITASGNSTDTISGNNTHTGAEDTNRDIKISGATGRLTAPEMIELQRNIYLNLYQQIADDFAHELCVMVY